MLINGGKTNYGQDIGILMLDTIFPRIVGDIGNARTFAFPVRYKVVRSAVPTKVVLENDRQLLDLFIAGAKELEYEGVRAITTSCGFLAIFQQELAAAVSIPVFTSSLLQVPWVERLLPPGKDIIIVTAHKDRLTSRHLSGVGINSGRYSIVGLESKEEFFSTFVLQKPACDLGKLTQEISETAKEIKASYPNAGALVLECTNLPPFRKIFQQEMDLPIFDIVTLVNYVQASFDGNR